MFKNFLTSAIRNLKKQKLFAAINIGGLGLGMAVAVLIMLYVRNELSYDVWVPQQERIFRVYRHFDDGAKVVWSPGPLAKALDTGFPEVERSTALTEFGEALLEYDNEKFYVDRVALTDSNFFELVSLPFLYGTHEHALQHPNSVVLSRSLAERCFGPEDPVGEPLHFNGEPYVVAGVLAEMPGNTHLQYDVYARIYWESPSWTGNNRATYVLLHEQADLAQVEAKITPYINQFLEKEFLEHQRTPQAGDFPDWKLQPFKDIHLHSGGLSWMGDSGGDIKYVYIFSLVALIVLLIAGINYMNLATADAAQRAKEVGVRKVSGARRRQLILQFLSESVFKSFLALVLALALVELALPFFNEVVHRELSFLQGNFGQFVAPLLGIMLGVGLLAGIYPAFVLSSFRPVEVLKGVTSKASGGQWFRRALVVAQFSISVVLIIVIAIIFRQVSFMLDQELGFAGEQVMVIPMNDSESFRGAERLKEEFIAIDGVTELATASRVPGDLFPDWGVFIEEKHEDYDPNVLFAGEGYDAAVGLELLEGRFFSSDHPADTLNNFVVNESFVRQYGVEDPVGKRVKFTFEEEYGQIVGVVRDFHFKGLHLPIRPLIIGSRPNRWRTVLKLSTGDFQKTIAEVEKLWAKVEPAYPMRYSFLDDDFAQQYAEYERFGRTMLYAAVLAIFIAVLGLFGLASHAAARRTKEIGVRKILGATTRQLTLMLISDFVRWVFLAGLIAIPVGYLLSRKWLEDFAYQTDLSPFPFLIALCTALAVATLTVSFQAVRAASGNPADALRYE